MLKFLTYEKEKLTQVYIFTPSADRINGSVPSLSQPFIEENTLTVKDK